jgi:prevent-host-death family protein
MPSREGVTDARGSDRHTRVAAARTRRRAVAKLLTRRRVVPFLLLYVSMSISTKSVPIPVANARKNFSDVVAQAREGQRIKLTRHGKNVAWIIGPSDRTNLATTKSKRKRRRTKP